MKTLAHHDRVIVTREIGGIAVDLGGVLVQEPSIHEPIAAMSSLPGAREWIREAFRHFGHNIAVLTSMNLDSATFALEKVLELRGEIGPGRLSAGSYKSRYVEVFKHTAARLKIPASELLVIDDSADVIFTALAAGCKTVWIGDADEDLLFSAIANRPETLESEVVDRLGEHVTRVHSVTSICFARRG